MSPAMFHFQKFGLLSIVVVVCVQYCSGHMNAASQEVKVAEFDLKPGAGTQDIEQGWDEFKCKFTYTCQGGTNENWVMSLGRSQDHKEYYCNVERANKERQSYLFFQNFKLSVTGAEITEIYATNIDGDLKPEEYKLEKTSVQDVPGVFRSQLTSLTASAIGHTEEL